MPKLQWTIRNAQKAPLHNAFLIVVKRLKESQFSMFRFVPEWLVTAVKGQIALVHFLWRYYDDVSVLQVLQV
ncbi:MAG: hypothetical protein AB8B84_07725 [Granulosicoccus sp.]